MRINGFSTRLIDVADRGLQYGDGLFETISVVGGKPQFWSQHMGRLLKGCSRLGIDPPSTETMLGEAAEEIGSSVRGVLKIMITRGHGGRGYRLPEAPSPCRILAYHPWPDYADSNWNDGVCVRCCRTRLGQNPVLAGMKHLNRLEQVLARAEWVDPDIAEGLMLDTSDRLIEGTMSNLFLLRHGDLLTPDLSQCGVEGVMRGFVLNTACSLGISTHVTRLEMSDLAYAEAVFLTNSVIGIWPVRDIAGRSFGISAIPKELIQATTAVSRGFD